MDLQPTCDMPYGRSLGEDDKGRTPDPKGPIKTSQRVRETTEGKGSANYDNSS